MYTLYLSTTKLVEIFAACDDFIIGIEEFLAQQSLPGDQDLRSKRPRQMSKSEMMSIVIYYHVSGFKCFKWYYNLIIRKALIPIVIGTIFQLLFLAPDSFN